MNQSAYIKINTCALEPGVFSWSVYFLNSSILFLLGSWSMLGSCAGPGWWYSRACPGWWYSRACPGWWYSRVGPGWWYSRACPGWWYSRACPGWWYSRACLGWWYSRACPGWWYSRACPGWWYSRACPGCTAFFHLDQVKAWRLHLSQVMQHLHLGQQLKNICKQWYYKIKV